MRILLTGGGGYLGTTLVRALCDAQWYVHVLDRFDHGTQPLLSATARSHRRVTVFPGDVRDARVVTAAMVKCDAIIHLAGVVGYPACDANPDDAEGTNVNGTYVVAMAAAGRPLLFASTGSTYGRVLTSLATEDLPVSPLTLYGRTKAAGEIIVQGVGGVSLRLATLFGPSCRMRWDLLPHDFARQAATTGEIPLYQGGASRTFLHVQDAAAAFLEVLEVWSAAPGLFSGQVFNVGGHRGNITKRGVAKLAQDATGCRIVDTPGEDPDQRDYQVAFGKFHQAVPAWAGSPVRTLEETMPVLVQWARGWK